MACQQLLAQSSSLRGIERRQSPAVPSVGLTILAAGDVLEALVEQGFVFTIAPQDGLSGHTAVMRRRTPLQQRHEADAIRQSMRSLPAQQLGQGRVQVQRAHACGNALGRHTTRPHDCKGHTQQFLMQSMAVITATMLPELLAVVGVQDHHRVVQFS